MEIDPDSSGIEEALLQLGSIGFVRESESAIIRFKDLGIVFVRRALIDGMAPEAALVKAIHFKKASCYASLYLLPAG